MEISIMLVDGTRRPEGSRRGEGQVRKPYTYNLGLAFEELMYCNIIVS